tara:strand:- start:254 stop:586 length:333 start_codon:yes stop_codon:yes gene_type:complete
MLLTEKSLRRKIRGEVRRLVLESRTKLHEEDAEMKDELSKIINTLGVGKDINKSTIAAALKAGDGRNAKQNEALASLFMAVLNNPDMMTKMIPLLKKAAEETEESPKFET